MADQIPQAATLAPPVAAAQPVKVTVRAPKAPKKGGAKRAGPKAQTLAALAAHLEAQWGAAMEAHQARVRRDFAALQKALKAKPAKAAKDAKKLETLLGKKVKSGKGRLKDLRRAEGALDRALDRIRA